MKRLNMILTEEEQAKIEKLKKLWGEKTTPKVIRILLNEKFLNKLWK